jgi:hypothetical protein
MRVRAHRTAVLLLALLASSALFSFAEAAAKEKNQNEKRQNAEEALNKTKKNTNLDSTGRVSKQKRTKLRNCLNQAATNAGRSAILTAATGC